VPTADGLGWPDGGSSGSFAGEVGLGWPGTRGDDRPLGSSRVPSEGMTQGSAAGPPEGLAAEGSAGESRAGSARGGGQSERLSSPEDEGSRGTLVNGQDTSAIPGSERVRQALSAAVSRGTPGPGGVGDNIPPLVSANAEVVVPEVRANPADTPIGYAAETAVGVRVGGKVREDWPRPSRCRIMTIANQKGGVGKTTTAVNLAASLSQHGSRVLVVDLDPQGNASTALDVEHHVGVASVYNALVEEASFSDIVVDVPGMPGLYCAPATIDLAGAEIELVPMVAREQRLSRAIRSLDVSNLDYVLIDCPPSLGLLTVNALCAAEEVLIPIQCEYYALEGLEQLLRTVELVRGHLNNQLRISTILLTMYDGRTRLATQVADDVRSHFGEVVLKTIIPRSVRVSEAPSYGQSVITYDPASSGALAYVEAARELAMRSGGL
jgi:chromosome partitioning protein